MGCSERRATACHGWADEVGGTAGARAVDTRRATASTGGLQSRGGSGSTQRLVERLPADPERTGRGGDVALVHAQRVHEGALLAVDPALPQRTAGLPFGDLRQHSPEP